MAGISNDSYSPYGIDCSQCNENLIAPDWSTFVSERHVSHAWSCERCGHQFETSYYLQLATHKPNRFLLSLGDSILLGMLAVLNLAGLRKPAHRGLWRRAADTATGSAS